MNKKVPFKSNFDNAKKFDFVSVILLYISTILMLGNFLLAKLSTPPVEVAHWIDICNCIFILSFAICEFIVDYIHFNAETYRRNDLIDNAFGTVLAEDRTENYYTNNKLPEGLYKLGVNNFESCFFSYRIANKSLLCSWIKTGIISLIFILCAISGFDEVAIFIIQLAIPLILVQQSIKSTLYVTRLKDVFSKYRTLFNNLKKNNKHKNFEAELIREILEYEATISWGNTLLDEKTYNQMNDMLSSEWNKLKQEYSII
jgi:hypothetical protein